MTAAEPTEENWRLFAACRGHNPDWWFPEPHQKEARDTAIRICRTCPVQQQCDLHAEINGERHGIWAGRTSKKRIEDQGQPTRRPRSTRSRPLCGTMSGYRSHLHYGEIPDERCKTANAEYVRGTRARAAQRRRNEDAS